MTRRRKETLRTLTDEEQVALLQISWSHSEAKSHVATAKGLLAVAAGRTYKKLQCLLIASRVIRCRVG